MARAEPRVAITGIGMITCLGTGVAECWPRLVAGHSGIGPIRRFDASACETRFGGELPDGYAALEAAEFTRRQMKQMLPTTRLGLLCAKQAIEDSGFSLAAADPYRCGIVTASSQPSCHDVGEAAGPAPMPAMFRVIRQMPNALAGWISIHHGFQGRAYHLAAACAAGSDAVATAGEFIRSGRGDAALAVGVDMLLSAPSIQGFNAVSALSVRNGDPARASRPFDRDRDGFVMADGGAALMLEREDDALARGARIYAILVGAAMTSEAFNILAPKPRGEEMARTMALALADAGIAADAVDYVDAHGTSTQQNDLDETLAIKTVFGAHARRLAVSSQKSMVGHCVSGAGAIECAVTALSLHHGVIAPTINYTTPDPECDLDYVPNAAREVPGCSVAISNSFGFGGHNVTLVLQKAAGQAQAR